MATSAFLQSSVVLMLVLIWANPAIAAWPTDSLVNVPLCTADSTQRYPRIVADGTGGAIVAWADDRPREREPFGIFAQHALANGEVDPAWPSDGRAICTQCGWASTWKLLADGAGGVIVSWVGARNRGVHAQHLLASGQLDQAWPADGVAASSDSSYKEDLEIVTDGAGGAILIWVDTHNEKTLWDIYAQHVLKSGVVDSAWPSEGRALCIAPGRQFRPTIVPDGDGGAIVAWQDQRRNTKLLSGRNYHDFSGNIFAQHLLANGDVDPAWSVNGRCLSDAGKLQRTPKSVSDGAGGAIVTWVDSRKGSNHDDIYAQRVLANGTVDISWPRDGICLCDASGSQEYPAIVADDAGGAIVSWQDWRAGRCIYAQRVVASGNVDPSWPNNGLALCAPAENEVFPSMVADGAGGAIVGWMDSPPYSSTVQDPMCGGSRVERIYSQHVLGRGVVSPAWPAAGRVVCFAVTELDPQLAADASGGVIVAFRICGSRSGSAGSALPPDEGDIFVKRVSATGQLGGTAAGER
jgi:hypothetical protein